MEFTGKVGGRSRDGRRSREKDKHGRLARHDDDDDWNGPCKDFDSPTEEGGQEQRNWNLTRRRNEPCKDGMECMLKAIFALGITHTHTHLPMPRSHH